MSSAESKGFHKFCHKYLPFLLIQCPDGNLHFLWRNKCQCCDYNDYPKYKFNYFLWKWKKIEELENA